MGQIRIFDSFGSVVVIKTPHTHEEGRHTRLSVCSPSYILFTSVWGRPGMEKELTPCHANV